MNRETDTVSDTVLEVNQDMLDSAGGTSCCIDGVPTNFLQIDEAAYLPEVVSMGVVTASCAAPPDSPCFPPGIPVSPFAPEMSNGSETLSDTDTSTDPVLHYMDTNRKKRPLLLRSSAGGGSCCIYRVPKNFLRIGEAAYLPEVVSIGPYHHGEEHLKAIEEHKWRLLDSFLLRTQRGLRNYIEAIRPLEKKARDCYSETIPLDSNKFIQMLVLDGCFIIEFLRKFCREETIDEDDPIFLLCISNSIRRDLLRLENQIPFFVLKRLFKQAKKPGDSLAKLVLKCFTWMPRPEKVYQDCSELKGKHLLDLMRASFLPPNCTRVAKKENESAKVFPNATKLQLAGIKFEAVEADSLMDIKFTNGILKIPKMGIDNDIDSFFKNCIMFEQHGLHPSELHFTTYTLFMDCLIDTPDDVGVLRNNKIIENHMGSDEQIARFFNELGREAVYNPRRSYLSEQFQQVSDYYFNDGHIRWATLINTYFNTTWSGIATVAASILLLLTLAQTFFAIFGYFRPP